MLPTTRKRWRKAEDGSGALEEYWDIAFPDDERDANPSTFKFFQAAQNWAAQRDGAGGAGLGDGIGGGGLSYDMPDDSDDDDDDGDEDAASADGKSDGKEDAMDQDDE
jgi:crooked neck